jgi:CelD/BcsL family acetyltransferase involved in cellulose biosynthesis
MTSLRLEVIPPDELPEEARAAWRRLQLLSPDLRHPMLAPAFTEAAARHRQGIRVAVLHDSGSHVGFFPFQSDSRGIGVPVAHRLNDYQTVLLDAGVTVDTAWLLRGCGLHTWQFDNLLPVPPVFAEGRFRLEAAPFIDLSGGGEAPLEAASGASRRKKLLRQERRLERDLGPVRFEFHSTDPAAFDAVLQWKSRQKQRTGVRDVFAWPWVRPMLDDLLATGDPDCAGTLSVLYAGDTLAAVHLGVRSGEILHLWIPAYNPDLRQHSPGALLLARLILESGSRGLGRIDMGKGTESYKAELQTGAVMMASGAVCTTAWARWLRRGSHFLEERLRTSPIAPPAKRLRHWLDQRSNRQAVGNSPGR